MPSPEASTVVCVLGMHRSGTSLTARIVNLAGVYLGSEQDLLGVGRGNPAGFWEHIGFLMLNERILKAHGGRWKDPPELSDGWERSELLSALREEARALVQNFDGRSVWGWKDPRNCLTLPFWLDLRPEVQSVICLRNPIDVATSLKQQQDMTAERAFALWLEYMSAALKHTSGRPRLFVSYERYFDDRRAQVERVTRFLGDGAAAIDDRLESSFEEAVKAEHRHFHSSPEDLATHPQVPQEVTSLYRRLLCYSEDS